MTRIRDAVVERIWRGNDPFVNFPTTIYQVDKQGWNDQHPYLTEAMSGDPLLVIEVGVWKGGSTLAMADRMREKGIDGAVLAIDTWLGSAEHWLGEEWLPHLGLTHGYPSIQRKFMANVIDSGLQDYIVPLPMDSINASEIVKALELEADVIHIDAGHDYASVMADLAAWWPLLKPGGLYIGDDYFDEGVVWPEVFAAHNDFLKAWDIADFEHVDGKCRVRKP